MARASGELTVDQEDADTREPIPIHRERVSIHVTVRSEADVTAARVTSRDLALREGFTEAEASAVATAVFEVAWNLVVHTGKVEVVLATAVERGRRGLVVAVREEGPGIGGAEGAREDGISTGRALELGLSRARRLMDEFSLVAGVAHGTTVTMRKWCRVR